MPVNSILTGFGSPTWNLARTACEKDDTSLIAQALSAVSSQDDLESLHRYSCRHAIDNNSANVLTYLIEHGANVQALLPMVVAGSGHTSKAILEILLANGWDINWRDASCSDPNCEPFMWHVIDDYDMVAWCLEHGASVFPKDQEPLRDDTITLSQRCCRQILERAAAKGTVATFELLRSEGAQLGWRPLHLAVENATLWPRDRGKEGADDEKQTGTESDHEKHEGTKSENARKYAERLAMIRHLIDVVGLDVNALDQPVGSRFGGRNGTPICYIAAQYGLGTNTRELTWLLLDRGADPNPGLEMAKRVEHEGFEEDVEAWKAKHRSGTQSGASSQCNVQ
ncbi:hypothetical protein K458DRAFT_416003 [Lentithecium fluviatile CBS 122367]|uniref:Ankyrin n=1 Tax=Lentithecium fluviatile CBS 122367 TaxID=1168545 RepID=A0A6G1J917_9PLEO|nr:hypothetical protein K458DRAFT_416003 [Lentithecium fluviatile CBS 122367]